ncbi:hypothetical protein Tco_0458703 [Tanacetum coccineum]
MFASSGGGLILYQTYGNLYARQVLQRQTKEATRAIEKLKELPESRKVLQRQTKEAARAIEKLKELPESRKVNTQMESTFFPQHLFTFVAFKSGIGNWECLGLILDCVSIARSSSKQWMRSTTEHCTIILVLIAIVAFAAAYTVP